MLCQPLPTHIHLFPCLPPLAQTPIIHKRLRAIARPPQPDHRSGVHTGFRVTPIPGIVRYHIVLCYNLIIPFLRHHGKVCIRRPGLIAYLYLSQLLQQSPYTQDSRWEGNSGTCRRNIAEEQGGEHFPEEAGLAQIAAANAARNERTEKRRRPHHRRQI